MRKQESHDKKVELTEEENNTEKRNSEPLINSEFLTFFFSPVSLSRGGFDNYELNKVVDERYIQHGFEKKLEQNRIARLYGIIFYFGLAVIIALIII